MGRDNNAASPHDRAMELSSTLSWLVDAAADSAGANRFLAELGAHLIADGLPLAGGALTLDTPHPLIARRTWLWRADNGEVIEALGFAPGVPPAAPGASGANDAGRRWLATIAAGPVHEDTLGPGHDVPRVTWIGPRPFTSSESDELREAARFAAAPLAVLAARATLTAALEAYLGRRSAGAGGTVAPRSRREHPGCTAVCRSARLHAAIGQQSPRRGHFSSRRLVRSYRRRGSRVRRRGAEIHRRRRVGDLSGRRGNAARRLRCRIARGVRSARRHGPSRCAAASARVADAAVRRRLASWRDSLGQYRRGGSPGFHRHRPRRQFGQPAGGAVQTAGQDGAGVRRACRRDANAADRARNACAARHYIAMRGLHAAGELSRHMRHPRA